MPNGFQGIAMGAVISLRMPLGVCNYAIDLQLL